MSTDVFLVAGDASTTTPLQWGVSALELTNGTDYLIVPNSWKAPPAARLQKGQEWGVGPVLRAEERVVSFDVMCFGPSMDVATHHLRALKDLLQRARRASGPYPQGTPVCLWVRQVDSLNYVFFDVIGGSVVAGYHDYGGTSAVQLCTVTLRCLPYARGAPVTLSTSGTIGMANNFAYTTPLIAGDAPAICALTITDVSANGAVLNKLIIGRRAVKGYMAAADFNPVMDLSNVLSPASGVNDATAFGGTYIRLAAINAWQDVCNAASPGSKYGKGEFDLFLRVRDNTATIATPTNVGVNPLASGGTITAGSYGVYVTELDAGSNETSPAGGNVVQTVGTAGSIAVSWTVQGTPTNHKVYLYNYATNAWTNFTTGSSSGSYTITSAAGGGAPPPGSASSAILPSWFKALPAVAATTPNYLDNTPFPAQLGASRWEWLYAGLAQTPPLAMREIDLQAGTAYLNWLLKVQAESGGTAAVNVDVDAAVLMPHEEPQLTLTYYNGTLATQRVWVYDLNRAGNGSCVLRSKADGTVQGQVAVEGQFTLEGGAVNTIIVIPHVGSFVADVGNAQFTLGITYTPRYEDVRGIVGGFG